MLIEEIFRCDNHVIDVSEERNREHCVAYHTKYSKRVDAWESVIHALTLTLVTYHINLFQVRNHVLLITMNSWLRDNET